MNIINGKILSEKILDNLQKEIKLLKVKPSLDIILIGKDPNSLLYIEKKTKKANTIGININIREFEKTVKEEEVAKAVRELNEDKNCNGYYIQLPLPKQINEQELYSLIDPKKDVDGLSPINQGKILQGDFTPPFPATVLAVIKILDSLNLNLESKNCVIVNHSNIIGKPLAAYLINQNATVTICNKYTLDLAAYTKNADILISATGVPHLINSEMVKEGCIVIDVGTGRLNGKICGDVDFENVKNKAKAITPVPGGVGPMTIACLLENVLKLYKEQNK